MKKSPLEASESLVTWTDHQCRRDCCAEPRLERALTERNQAVQRHQVPGRSAVACSSTELNSDQEISYWKGPSSLGHCQATALLSSTQTPCQSHHQAYPAAQQTEVEKMEEDICRKELKLVQYPKLKLYWAYHQQLTHPIQSEDSATESFSISQDQDQ